MAGCADHDCKENLKDKIDDIKITVYGEDGSHGLVGCVREKVSRKAIAAFTLAIVGSVTITAISGLTAWGNSQEKIHKNSESILVMEEQLRSIAKNQEQIKAQIKEIRDRQLNQKDLLREIKKLIESTERNGG